MSLLVTLRVRDRATPWLWMLRVQLGGRCNCWNPARDGHEVDCRLRTVGRPR